VLPEEILTLGNQQHDRTYPYCAQMEHIDRGGLTGSAGNGASSELAPSSRLPGARQQPLLAAEIRVLRF
jgi:hypothetical protein